MVAREERRTSAVGIAELLVVSVVGRKVSIRRTDVFFARSNHMPYTALVVTIDVACFGIAGEEVQRLARVGPLRCAVVALTIEKSPPTSAGLAR